MYDVAVIGAGVIGCSIARELSKYEIKVCVLEQRNDVAVGTSKANSGIVHAGFDAEPGSLKAKLNREGNAMFDALKEELDVPFVRNGSLVLCFDEESRGQLEALLERGKENGIQDLSIIEKDEIRNLEPNVNEDVVAALYARTGGIVCPYELTLAFAQNAQTNGVEFKFQYKVDSIMKEQDSYLIQSADETVRARVVINAAGLYADIMNNMVSEHKIRLIPRKGEYCLLDRSVGNMAKRTLFQLPTKMGKGVLVTPTVDGNLLIGPTAYDVEDKENLETTREGIEEVLTKAKLTLKEVPTRQIITSFAGNRAHLEGHDFLIEEVKDAKGFINVAGIESPGLTSAPAIGIYVREIVETLLPIKRKDSFCPSRKGLTRFREMSNEERNELIRREPAYGRIICRCETITEGEVIEAIRQPLGAKDMDGLKKRTRSGMGRCQSGFCSTKLLDILARELQIPQEEITKSGGNSIFLVGENKEV